MRSSRLICTLVLFALTALTASSLHAQRNHEECTTAIISGEATPDGRPILWKNRDTDQLSNRVVYVKETPFSYLALVNAEDSSGRRAWSGLNAVGFAIMNSVAYNLPQGSGEEEDLEGIIMADALRTCATVRDFEEYLKHNLGPNLGSRANFGVIDAQGGAALFEVYNLGYKRFDARDFPEKYIINTNFSQSGRADAGMGYLRFDRATEIFKSAPPRGITVEFILQVAARDLGHPLLHNTPRDEWKKLPTGTPYWVHTNHTVNRPSTAGTVVIHGIGESEEPIKPTMWTILGEPVTSIAVPLWVDAGETPLEMRGSTAAPICDEAKRLKDLLRPLKGSDRHEYADVTKLDNNAGSGWLPLLLKTEREILAAAAKLEQTIPSPARCREFEGEAAARVFKTLKSIH